MRHITAAASRATAFAFKLLKQSLQIFKKNFWRARLRVEKVLLAMTILISAIFQLSTLSSLACVEKE